MGKAHPFELRGPYPIRGKGVPETPRSVGHSTVPWSHATGVPLGFLTLYLRTRFFPEFGGLVKRVSFSPFVLPVQSAAFGRGGWCLEHPGPSPCSLCQFPVPNSQPSDQSESSEVSFCFVFPTPQTVPLLTLGVF